MANSFLYKNNFKLGGNMANAKTTRSFLIFSSYISHII